MGEYARHGDQQVKLGTAEDLMYVTRADIEALAAAGWIGEGGCHDLTTYLQLPTLRCCLPDASTPGCIETIHAREPDFANRIRIPLPRELMEPLKPYGHVCVYVDVKGVRLKMPCPWGMDRDVMRSSVVHEPRYSIDLVAEGLGTRRAVFACPLCDHMFNLIGNPVHTDVAGAFSETFKGSPEYDLLVDLVEAGLPVVA